MISWKCVRLLKWVGKAFKELAVNISFDLCKLVTVAVSGFRQGDSYDTFDPAGPGGKDDDVICKKYCFLNIMGHDNGCDSGTFLNLFELLLHGDLGKCIQCAEGLV